MDSLVLDQEAVPAISSSAIALQQAEVKKEVLHSFTDPKALASLKYVSHNMYVLPVLARHYAVSHNVHVLLTCVTSLGNHVCLCTCMLYNVQSLNKVFVD